MAGWRDDIIFAEVEGRWAIVVGVVPDDYGGDAQTRAWAGIGAFDGVEQVFRVDGSERFADGGERIAQVVEWIGLLRSR